MEQKNLSIGIDIGGTNTVFGLVNRRGEILAQGKISTRGHETVTDFVHYLNQALQPIINATSISEIAGIGIGAPNANLYTGEISNAANLPWKGVLPLAKIVTETTGLPTKITNDANAAAYGEMMYGVAKGLQDFIMVTLGTGLGSGIVSNGMIINGHDGHAGELGHVIALRNGRVCGCGRNGCLERYVSATGIMHTAKEWLANTHTPSLLRAFEAPTASQIFDCAEKGDELAIEIFTYTGEILGTVLADAVAITSPQSIIFFGGLAQAGDWLLKPAKEAMENNLLSVYKGKVNFLHSALPHSDAAILGSSALVW